MCYSCFEIAKENATPKQVWSLYSELTETDDPEHLNEFIRVLNNTSIEFQEKVANETPVKNV